MRWLDGNTSAHRDRAPASHGDMRARDATSIVGAHQMLAGLVNLADGETPRGDYGLEGVARAA